MKTILIVEDNSASRELIREILLGTGHQVFEAGNGEEALQLVREKRPDLVLLDIQLPKLDGFAVLRQLRQNPQSAHLHVVAVTAYAMRGDRERALSAGFDGYITKPIDSAALITQIHQLLQQKSSAKNSKHSSGERLGKGVRGRAGSV